MLEAKPLTVCVVGSVLALACTSTRTKDPPLRTKGGTGTNGLVQPTDGARLSMFAVTQAVRIGDTIEIDQRHYRVVPAGAFLVEAVTPSSDGKYVAITYRPRPDALPPAP